MASERSDVPVLLLPGTLCDARLFAPMLAHLPAIDAATIDLAGDDIRALARRIAADAPPRFAMIGFSLGGIVALEVAALVPERVAGLALIATNARPAPAAGPRRAAVAEAARRGLATYVGEVLWPDYVAAARRGDAALRGTIVDMAAGMGDDAFRRHTEIALGRSDSRPRLGALAMPALVVVGADDAVCPLADSEAIAAGMPDARLVVVPATGHFVVLEAPAAVAAAVAGWLRRLSGSVTPDQLP